MVFYGIYIFNRYYGDMSKKTPSGREPTKRVKTAKGRKLSSTLWLQRQLNDPYVQKMDINGNLSWVENGVQITSDVLDQSSVRMSPDRNGGAALDGKFQKVSSDYIV